MSKVIICGNQKGGVAKTTTVVNLGIGLARKGKKVLVIDNDPQGSLTEALGYQEPDRLEITLAQVMDWVLNEEKFDLNAGILHHAEGVDLMPANIELSGVETSLVGIVKNCDDDESTVIMVDANIQREDISVSEKAKAYRMKYDAMKHQGASGGISLAEMSESAGESRKTIQRLIYLSNLTEELLELIDNKKIGIAQGVDLAFISKEEQEVVFRVMQKTGVFINMEQSARIKNAVKDGLFNEQWLLEILSYKKPPVRKVVFNQNKLDSYFESNMTNEDIEGIIVKLLEEWKMKGGQV